MNAIERKEKESSLIVEHELITSIEALKLDGMKGSASSSDQLAYDRICDLDEEEKVMLAEARARLKGISLKKRPHSKMRAIKLEEARRMEALSRRRAKNSSKSDGIQHG